MFQSAVFGVVLRCSQVSLAVRLCQAEEEDERLQVPGQAMTHLSACLLGLLAHKLLVTWPCTSHVTSSMPALHVTQQKVCVLEDQANVQKKMISGVC